MQWSMLMRIFRMTGIVTIRFFESIFSYLCLIGEMVLSVPLLFHYGKQSFRDYCNELYLCGPKNFGIVIIIAFLAGIVIVAISAAQFQVFNAQIYAANLIGIAEARDFAPFTAAICLLFLTAARFTDEISAFKNKDKQIYSQCVIKILAVASVAPLLSLFAFYSSMLGGAIIGKQQFDIHWGQYWNQIFAAVTLTDIFTGLFKASLFGVEMAFLGCFYGLLSLFEQKTVGKSIVLALSVGILVAILTDSFMEIVIAVF